MYVILATGVAIWGLYGILKGDVVIIAANGVTLMLQLFIIGLKLRELTGHVANDNSGQPPSREPAS
jgi:MtN3 and saliva related transmembrane protein